MSNFIQIHFLTVYPSANLNRDDTGAPKTIVFGGATRLRVSSQSLKRAWRTSEVFKKNMEDYLGIRTTRIGKMAAQLLLNKGVNEEKAIAVGQQIANTLGKAKSKKNNADALICAETEQLVHVSPYEITKVKQIVEEVSNENSDGNDKSLNIFSKDKMAVDIALFGRMLASNPQFNVEAACQVAHAFGVSETIVEDDFFTAVDDLKNDNAEDTGAGHLGETAFGSAIFYNYICIDKDLLVKNLNGDKELADKAIKALLEAAMTVSPTGKQNSFASRSHAVWALVEKGEEQPRSLAAAFTKPISGSNQLADSIKCIMDFRDRMNQVYGSNLQSYCFNVIADTPEQQGSLSALLDFVTE